MVSNINLHPYTPPASCAWCCSHSRCVAPHVYLIYIVSLQVSFVYAVIINVETFWGAVFMCAKGALAVVAVNALWRHVVDPYVNARAKEYAAVSARWRMVGRCKLTLA